MAHNGSFWRLPTKTIQNLEIDMKSPMLLIMEFKSVFDRIRPVFHLFAEKMSYLGILS